MTDATDKEYNQRTLHISERLELIALFDGDNNCCVVRVFDHGNADVLYPTQAHTVFRITGDKAQQIGKLFNNT